MDLSDDHTRVRVAMDDDDEEAAEAIDLPSLQQLTPLLPRLAQAAQQAYNQWDQNEEGEDVELGSGGICQDVAEEMAGVLNEAGIDAITVSASMGEQHVWVVAKFREGVVEVDIPPSVYEIGGGYTWKKIPDVVFTPRDIHYSIIDRNPHNFDQYGEW
jgi:hypothetical protein